MLAPFPTKRQFLDYEINASRWWVGWICNEWLQHRVASYFAWKVNRKYRAYQNGLLIKEWVERRDRFFDQPSS